MIQELLENSWWTLALCRHLEKVKHTNQSPRLQSLQLVYPLCSFMNSIFCCCLFFWWCLFVLLLVLVMLLFLFYILHLLCCGNWVTGTGNFHRLLLQNRHCGKITIVNQHCPPHAECGYWINSGGTGILAIFNLN